MIAVSSASVPEVARKLCCSRPGEIRASVSASSTAGIVGYSVETCESRVICATTAALTFSLAWPTETVRIPPKKSRYSLPSASLIRIPWPSVRTSGSA